MKRIISLIIISIFIISAFGAVADNISQLDCNLIKNKYNLSKPNIIYKDGYSSIELDQATSYTLETNKPILPRISKIFELPIGSKIIDVDVKFSDMNKIYLTKDILTAPSPIIDGTSKKTINFETENDKIFYPENNFNYRISTGLNGEERKMFLSVNIYPIIYNIFEKSIYYYDNFDIEIFYKKPEKTIIFPDTYDLVIIAPAQFSEELQPLINHKNNFNLKTLFKTLESIYQEYPQGRDNAEKIKLFIYDAINPDGLNLGIKYVMLVGGMVGQKDEWYLPVRYISTPDEEGFLCDLYFADIFKEDGLTFDDWDSNGNGIFGEWWKTNKDIIDGAPDVNIGRIACTSESEVTIMVNKIINYEKEKAAESWFNKIILIGGDTYPDVGPDGAYEAEIDTQVSAEYMQNFTPVKLWASLETLTGQKSVENEINKGAGFVHMAGHANPSILITHPPDAPKSDKITILKIYSIPILDAFYSLMNKKGLQEVISNLLAPINPRLKNSNKLPVILIGGCHNSQFNTSIYSIISEGLVRSYGYGHHVPKCFSWYLTIKENGGAIATIGNSGLGMGIPGFNYPDGLDGWLLPRFFYHTGQMGEKYLGAAYSSAIRDYVNEFGVNKDSEDRQMVAQWILLGDPSLYMGGYE